MYGFAIRTFKNAWLLPILFPQNARTDAVKLAPGIYAAGTVLGNANFGNAAVDDVQTFTATGTPTGGSVLAQWVIDAVYQVTIPYNCTATVLQGLLDAVFGAGQFTAGGGAWPGTPLTVTAALQTKGQPIPLATIAGNNFTGGSSPAASVAHTTPGISAGGNWIAYASGASDGSQIAKMLLKYQTLVDMYGRHKTGGPGNIGVAGWSAPAYYRGYFRPVDLTGIDDNAVTNKLGKYYRGNSATLANAGCIIDVT